MAGSEVKPDIFHEISERGNHEDLSSEKLHKLPLGYGDYEDILFFLFGPRDGKLLANNWLKLR